MNGEKNETLSSGFAILGIITLILIVIGIITGYKIVFLSLAAAIIIPRILSTVRHSLVITK